MHGERKGKGERGKGKGERGKGKGERGKGKGERGKGKGERGKGKERTINVSLHHRINSTTTPPSFGGEKGGR